jgi:phage-related protein
MPQTVIYFYKDADGHSPVLEALIELRRHHRRAYAKCVALIRRLAVAGHELRRPHADILRDGIYELRATVGGVNFRMLYFFAGQSIAVVAHILTKERQVPAADIDRAIARRRLYEQDPARHQASHQIDETQDH